MAQSPRQVLLRALREHVASDKKATALDPSIVDDSIAVCSHFEEGGDLRLAAHLHVHDLGVCNRLFGPIEDWTFSKRVKDMSHLFCNSPTFNPDLGKWNVRHVENMEAMFAYNEEFEGIGLKHWKTPALANADGMFFRCTKFDADLDDWDVSNLASAESMFEACHSFNQRLAKWDTSKLRKATRMFGSCYALDSLDVSEWTVARLARAEGMFQDCVLANPDVSKWKPCSLLYAQQMFRNCKRFNASLAAWKEPRRKKKVDKTSDRVVKLPGTIFWDAFRDAAAFEWDVPVWMIAELSPIDRGVLQRLERRGTAPMVARDRAAARRFYTLGARLNLRKNHRIAMEEYETEIAVVEAAAVEAVEPQPLPRSEAEAQFYKTEVTTQTQLPPTAKAEDAFAGVPECLVPPAADEAPSSAPSSARWAPLPPDLLKLANRKRRRSADQRDRADYERVYGKGAWAKLPVRNQKAAAKDARAIKKTRRAAATEADAGGATLFDVEREEVEDAELSDDERDEDAPFEEAWEGTEDALNEHEELDMDAENVCDD